MKNFKLHKNITLLIITLLLCITPTFAAVDGALSMEAIKAKQEGNMEKVHILAQKIIAVNPDDPYGYNLEAEYLFENQKYPEALKYFSLVIEKCKTVKEKDSIRLRKMGMDEESIKQTLNYDSRIAEAYAYRGACHYKLSKINEALNDFINAEKYSSEKDVNIYFYKSICLMKLGQYDNALKNLNIAKTLANTQEEKDTINKMINYIQSKTNK